MSPRSCIVLGAGRSGTSLVAGTLAASGYWSGERLWDAGDANPKGFFEDREVNAINETLLATVLPKVPPGGLGRKLPGRLGAMQRWLAALPPGVEPKASRRSIRRMLRVLDTEPFALKDPRFSFTLPCWREFLPSETVFIAVYREPSRTIASTLREIESANYLRAVKRSASDVEVLWQRSYNRILSHYDSPENWIFLHYEQVLSGQMQRLGSMLGVEINDSFADDRLRRSPVSLPVSAETLAIYDKLNELAGYVPDPRLDQLA